MTPDDSLLSLWKAAPQPDGQNLLQNLQRLNRLHRRLKGTLLAVETGIALLLVFAEATGRLASRGVLSMAWIACIAAIAIGQRRSRCNRLDMLTLDTVSLLKAMIARAKIDLFLARCLYAGVPLGAAVGWVLSNLLSIGGSASARAAHPFLNMAQTGAGIAALIVMMAAGFILARSRSVQVRELREKLSAIEADL